MLLPWQRELVGGLNSFQKYYIVKGVGKKEDEKHQPKKWTGQNPLETVCTKLGSHMDGAASGKPSCFTHMTELHSLRTEVTSMIWARMAVKYWLQCQSQLTAPVFHHPGDMCWMHILSYTAHASQQKDQIAEGATAAVHVSFPPKCPCWYPCGSNLSCQEASCIRLGRHPRSAQKDGDGWC